MGEEKQELLRAFDELKKQGNFDISVCNNVHDIEDNPKYKKLEMTTQQKMQLSVKGFSRILIKENPSRRTAFTRKAKDVLFE